MELNLRDAQGNVLGFRDDYVVSDIPDDPGTWGVVDHVTPPTPGHPEAFLQAWQGGRPSAFFPVWFTAARDIQLLRENDPAVKILVQGSVNDHSGFSICPKASQPVNSTFSCRWISLAWFGDESGTDIHQVGPLANDWVLHSFFFQKSIDPGELEVRDPSPPFPAGGTFWDPHILWWVSPADTVWYVGYVYITGPGDVPH